MNRIPQDHRQNKSSHPTVEERVRAARVLLSMVGREERSRRGEPALHVVDGGRAA